MTVSGFVVLKIRSCTWEIFLRRPVRVVTIRPRRGSPRRLPTNRIDTSIRVKLPWRYYLYVEKKEDGQFENKLIEVEWG